MKTYFKIPLMFAVSLICLLTAGCPRKQKTALSVVLVCDVSASIEETARMSCLKTVNSLLPILHRGDSLAVVPVTGDAEVEASGQILRFPILAQRELYDEDLRRLRAIAEKEIGNLATSASAHPGEQTDLLGTVRVVAEELGSLPARQTGVVIVLTDFIQDDSQFNFNHAPELANRNSAVTLAANLAHDNPRRFPNTTIYCGYLKSRDLAKLGRSRREAIQGFWMEYLKRLGARPQTVVDGPGLLPRFLESIREPDQSNKDAVADALHGMNLQK